MFLRRIYIHIDKKCDTHKQPAIQTLSLPKVLLLTLYKFAFFVKFVTTKQSRFRKILICFPKLTFHDILERIYQIKGKVNIPPRTQKAIASV